MIRMMTGMMLATSAAMVPVGMARAADVDGSHDRPGISRYDDAEIRSYRQPALDVIVLPVGRIPAERPSGEMAALQGEVTHIDYRIEPATSALALERHYAAELADAGYRILFACNGEAACGTGMGALILNSGKVAPVGFADGLFNDSMRVIVARKDDDWLLLHMIAGPNRSLVYQVTVDGATPAG